jgi:hypothetical protein
MKKIFKWIYKPEGNCPVQSEGYFLGYYFYFRARHELATIEFYNKKEDFCREEPIYYFILKETSQHRAGWLSKRESMYLIFKGCLMLVYKLVESKIK